MIAFTTPILAAEITGTRVSLAHVRIKGKRAVVVQSATDTVTPRSGAGSDASEPAGLLRQSVTAQSSASEHAVVASVDKLVSMAHMMGFKRARLYLSVSSPYVETAHKVYKLPPMSASAAAQYLGAKLAGDFSASPNDVIWDRPQVRGTAGSGTRSIVTLAARRREMAPVLDLEAKGFTVELLTSPEMAVWALARRAGLLDHKDALLVYPTPEKVHLVAAGPTGPYFTRAVDVGAGLEGFVLMRTVLPAEVRHALIYLQQHQQRTVSRLIVVGSAVPDDAAQDLGRAVGIEVSAFGAEDLVVPPKAPAKTPAAEWSLLAASLPLTGALPPAVNLARTHVSLRQNIKTLGVVSWVVGLVLLAVMFKWGLELDIAEQQGTVRVSELERSVAELQKFPVPVDDWRVTEVKAISRLVEQTDLESPPWAEVLHELGHITSKPVRFDALTLSKGGVAPLPGKPAGRAAARKAAAKPKPTPAATGVPNAKGSDTPSTAWVLAVSGTVSGASFPQLQETFRAWYEDAVVSPYLARMDIVSAEIGKRTPTANRGATPAMARRRVDMTTGAAEPPEPESVLRFEVKSEVLTSDAVRSVVSNLDAKGGEGP